MRYAKLPNLQIKEIPLVQHERFCDRQKNVLLHGLRLYGLYVPSQAQSAQNRPDYSVFRPLTSIFCELCSMGYER